MKTFNQSAEDLLSPLFCPLLRNVTNVGGPICSRVGSAYSFVACLNIVTFEHESLARRGTFPTPSRDTPKQLGRSRRCFHVLHRNFSVFLSPSCFAACGHHLSPKIAIVFSLLSVSISSVSHSSSFFLFDDRPPHPYKTPGGVSQVFKRIGKRCLHQAEGGGKSVPLQQRNTCNSEAPAQAVRVRVW